MADARAMERDRQIGIGHARRAVDQEPPAIHAQPRRRVDGKGAAGPPPPAPTAHHRVDNLMRHGPGQTGPEDRIDAEIGLGPDDGVGVPGRDRAHVAPAVMVRLRIRRQLVGIAE